MSANETITTSSTGAQKAGNLERFDLIPVEALRELAEHYGRGALKYDDHNWRKGYEWGKSYAALCRHLTQFWNGEDIDPETGSKHIIAVAWHAFTLATYMDEHPEFDDRWSTVNAAETPAAPLNPVLPWTTITEDSAGLIQPTVTFFDGSISNTPEPLSDEALANWEKRLLGIPRVVTKLGEDEKGAEWIRESTQSRYRWNPARPANSAQTIFGAWDVYECDGWHFGGTKPGQLGGDSFTEVIE